MTRWRTVHNRNRRRGRSRWHYKGPSFFCGTHGELFGKKRPTPSGGLYTLYRCQRCFDEYAALDRLSPNLEGEK